MHASIFVASLMTPYAFQVCHYVARNNEISVKYIDAIPISTCLADSNHKLLGVTNISQVDYNEPFNEYNGDD